MCTFTFKEESELVREEEVMVDEECNGKSEVINIILVDLFP